MTTVIAAIDNSAAAAPVLVAAASLGRVLGAEVEAVYVTEDSDGETARQCAARAGVPFVCVRGEAVAEITGRAAATDVVGVVVGARRELTGRRIGHMARAVADRIDKPVLVVPPEATPVERLGTVLIAMEGSAAKAYAAKAVVEVAHGADLRLVVVHVDDASSLPAFSDQAAHETDAYAKEFLARYLRGAPEAHLEFRVGSPVDEILAASETMGADLLALGWPQTGDENRGRVAREVLDRAHVPVLLVAVVEPAA